MSLRAHLRYAAYVARHKVAVFRGAWHLGVPWLGLLHDLSKLRPDEWRPYATWFYDGPHQDWAEVSTYGKQHHFAYEWGRSQEARKEAFDRAWLLHLHRNRHHPQFWRLLNDQDGEVCLPMPERYIREMVADWLGAGMALKGHGWDRAPDECRAWWAANRDGSGYRMHHQTRARVEALLEALA